MLPPVEPARLRKLAGTARATTRRSLAPSVIHDRPGGVKRPLDVFDFRSGRLVAVRQWIAFV